MSDHDHTTSDVLTASTDNSKVEEKKINDIFISKNKNKNQRIQRALK
jgi:hypothetical protein